MKIPTIEGGTGMILLFAGACGMDGNPVIPAIMIFVGLALIKRASGWLE